MEIATETRWKASSKRLILNRDEVHLWRASLDLKESRLQELQTVLSHDEKKRADRFRFQKDREHFIAARGSLRTVLGLYLKVSPSQIRFAYNRYGKPALNRNFSPDRYNFNVAHSEGIALYAIALNREVGIDLEYIRKDFDYEEIAARYFSAGENADLGALPKNVRLKAFFNCWVRKEAYIKARGQGLSLPLDRFDVSLAPGEPATLLSVRDAPQEVTRWSLHEISVDPGYVAALAVEGAVSQLRYWQWLEL